MEYELINPSDPYTFIAKSKEVAALVVANISLAYAARPKSGEDDIPIFIFGGFEEWYRDEFGRDYKTGYSDLKEEISDALDSFMFGKFEDRERYEMALKCITDLEKREEFKEKWNDGISSMNDIGSYCHNLAKKLREGIK